MGSIKKFGFGTVVSKRKENFVQLQVFGETPKRGVNIEFQTPLPVCEYMTSWIPPNAVHILEPTPGMRNLAQTIVDKGYLVMEPENFFTMEKMRFDCVVMNPPFSDKWAFGIPENFEHKGMKLGYWMLQQCMEMSDNVIALVPWFTVSNSDLRLRYLRDYGLKAIVALPRKTFKYARIQTCILVLKKGWNKQTEFHVYDFPNNLKEVPQ